MIDGQPLACFQPFIDTATGRIAGVEALGRLRQADGQLNSVGPLFADPRTPAIALRTGMEVAFCGTVCAALRADSRLRSENSGADTRWFVPIAGEDLSRRPAKPTNRKAATA